MHTWERVQDEKYDATDRMEVPGGWIYRNITLCDYSSATANYVPTMVFVPNHEWKP